MADAAAVAASAAGRRTNSNVSGLNAGANGNDSSFGSGGGAAAAGPVPVSEAVLRDMLCEDWLEKYALCRSVFASKGWHPRHCFLTKEGLGYSRTQHSARPLATAQTGSSSGGGGKNNEPTATNNNNNSGGGGVVSSGPGGALMTFTSRLRPSDAKCFIAFENGLSGNNERRRPHSNDSLAPVYLYRDVTVFRHPALPATCKNGISCQWCVDEGGTLARDPGRTRGGKYVLHEANRTLYYYFALSFEERKKKRFYLFLRTPDALTYLKWVTFLPLLVHEGGRRAAVPVAHPLEVLNHPFADPKDMNEERIAKERGKAAGGNGGGNGNANNKFVFQRDPDPCTADEVAKIRTRVLVAWREGEAERLVRTRVAHVRDLLLRDAVVSAITETRTRVPPPPAADGRDGGAGAEAGAASVPSSKRSARRAAAGTIAYGPAITGDAAFLREVHRFDRCGPVMSAEAYDAIPPPSAASPRTARGSRKTNSKVDAAAAEEEEGATAATAEGGKRGEADGVSSPLGQTLNVNSAEDTADT